MGFANSNALMIPSEANTLAFEVVACRLAAMLGIKIARYAVGQKERRGSQLWSSSIV